MFFRKITKIFESGNVCVTGLRGCGKDMLISNVVARRKQPYVSNIDYGGEYYPLDFGNIDCGKNTFRNFISGKLGKYTFPYPMGSDIYISDVGVYLPSQYSSELDRAYPYLATYQALSRQVSRNNVHINCQHLGRAWNKLREQSDLYITCNRCVVLFGGRLVIQKVTLYDKYESCLNRVRPCRVRKPLLNREARTQSEIYLDTFYNQHGKVKSHWLIYRNKGHYDTHYFGNLLASVEPSLN